MTWSQVAAAPAQRASRFLFGKDSERAEPWLVAGASAFLLAELVAVIVALMVDPLVGLGLVVVPLFVALCFVSLPAAWILVVAMVPFSNEVYFKAIGAALWVPTEPMIFLFLGVWIVRALLRGTPHIPKSALFLWVALLGLAAALSTIQSQYPQLSVKAFLAVSWYVAFAFLFPYLHGRDGVLIRRGLYVLAGSSLLMSVYGLVFIARHGLNRLTANFMGWPFFAEHGTYSAFISVGLATLLALGLLGRGAARRVAAFTGASAVLLAVLLALARAAYLGLGGIFLVTAWHFTKAGRTRMILALLLLVGVAAYGLHKFKAGEFVGLYTSTITQPGEPSNLERISRWLAAYNMVRARPLLGIGYGAYPSSYFQYRVLTLKTGEQFKRMGVHSEYIKVVAETGILGTIALVGFIVSLFRAGSRAIRRAANPEAKILALGALAGVSSYLVHAFFNNYSGTDKLNVPFWFCIAAVAVLEARTRIPVAAPQGTA
jgi:O-antigen ligase